MLDAVSSEGIDEREVDVAEETVDGQCDVVGTDFGCQSGQQSPVGTRAWEFEVERGVRVLKAASI